MARDCKKCKYFQGMHPNYNDSFACQLDPYCSWMEYEAKKVCKNYEEADETQTTAQKCKGKKEMKAKKKPVTIETFGFGMALELLKEGKKVCRSGWNGKGMFLTLQGGSVVTGTMMRNKPAKDFYGDGEVRICPHIDMKAADGSYVVGWIASQTDMLADDWMVA